MPKTFPDSPIIQKFRSMGSSLLHKEIKIWEELQRKRFPRTSGHRLSLLLRYYSNYHKMLAQKFVFQHRMKTYAPYLKILLPCLCTRQSAKKDTANKTNTAIKTSELPNRVSTSRITNIWTGWIHRWNNLLSLSIRMTKGIWSLHLWDLMLIHPIAMMI